MARTTNRTVCLPEEMVDQIKKADLANRTPEDRMFVLKSIFGEQNGLDMARLFNKSLLLKNQENALNRFISNASLKLNPEKKLELKKRIAQDLMNKRLKMYNIDGTINKNFIDSERTEDEILKYTKDILDEKYDLKIDIETVKRIQSIKNELPKLKESIVGTAPESEERLAYGLKLMELKDITNELSGESLKRDGFLKRIASGFSENKIDAKTGKTMLDKKGLPIKIKTPVTGIFNALGEVIDTAFNPTLKSIKASLDNSGFSRQGIKILGADWRAWVKQFMPFKGQTWKTLSTVFKKDAKKKLKEAKLAHDALMMADDDYDEAIDSGLAIIGKEDYFPESKIAKMPVVGSLFQASDDAYTMATQGARFDIFKRYKNQYIKQEGVQPTKEILKGYARVANSASGRGGLGQLESSAGLLNKIFFSARFQTAQLNTFKHAFDLSLPIQARKIAQKNLANYLLYVGGLMTAFSLFTDVGFDLRENTFGKVRLLDSDKWVDVTGGTASMISTLFRTGAKVIDIATGNQTKYGQDNAFDLLINFASGKLAPVPGTVASLFKERETSPDMPLPIGLLTNLFLPIGLQQPLEDVLAKEELDATAMGFILEFLGSGTSKPYNQDGVGSYWKPTDLLRK
jgi:hypothetical protein